MAEDKVAKLVGTESPLEIGQKINEIIEKGVDSNTGGFKLFDTKIADHILSYEESGGWALQGTYVYSTGIEGERYGYPDFVQECIFQKNESVPTQVTLGSSTITMYINENGHQFYDITDKAIIDTWFESQGIADFYGVDAINQCVFLPRNKYFTQLTTDVDLVNKMNAAGLPSLSHTHTRGTMNITGTFSGHENNATGAFTASTTTEWHGNRNTNGQKRKVTFDASKSWTGSTSTNSAVSAIYGKSKTVQPPSSNKLLYYCVGNTVSDLLWYDFDVQIKAGIKSIEDKTEEGIARLEEAGAEQLPIATTDSLGAVKPDGTTITIDENGTISSVGSGSSEIDTSNLVTLNGNEIITGTKTFANDIQLGSNSISFSDGAITLNPQGSTSLNVGLMGGALDISGNLTLNGSIKAYQHQDRQIELRSDGTTMSMVYGDNALQMSDNSLIYSNASGQTKNLLESGGGSSDNVVTIDTDQTITGKKTFNVEGASSPKTLNIKPHIDGTKDGTRNSFSIKGTDGYSDFLGVSCNRSGGYPYNVQTVVDFTSDLQFTGYRGGSTVSFGTQAWNTRPQVYTTGNGVNGYKPLLHFGNIIAGSGVTITDNGENGITLSASGGGSSGESEFTFGKNYTHEEDEGMITHNYLKHTPSSMVIAGGYVAPSMTDNYIVVNFEQPLTEASLLVINDTLCEIPWYALIWDSASGLYTGFEAELETGDNASWIVFGY